MYIIGERSEPTYIHVVVQPSPVLLYSRHMYYIYTWRCTCMYLTMHFGPVYKLCTCIWDPRGPGTAHVLLANVTSLASSTRHQCIASTSILHVCCYTVTASLHEKHVHSTCIYCIYTSSISVYRIHVNYVWSVRYTYMYTCYIYSMFRSLFVYTPLGHGVYILHVLGYVQIPLTFVYVVHCFACICAYIHILSVHMHRRVNIVAICVYVCVCLFSL